MYLIEKSKGENQMDTMNTEVIGYQPWMRKPSITPMSAKPVVDTARVFTANKIGDLKTIKSFQSSETDKFGYTKKLISSAKGGVCIEYTPAPRGKVQFADLLFNEMKKQS
jgi:hypothetical protein